MQTQVKVSVYQYFHRLGGRKYVSHGKFVLELNEESPTNIFIIIQPKICHFVIGVGVGVGDAPYKHWRRFISINSILANITAFFEAITCRINFNKFNKHKVEL
jgi:hypothetical protein